MDVFFGIKEVENNNTIKFTEIILANIVGNVKITYVTDLIVDIHLMSIFNLIIAGKLCLTA